MVEGYGYTKAQNSASIVLSTGGTVEEVFVKGTVTSSTRAIRCTPSTPPPLTKAVSEAQKTVSNYQKQLQAIYDSYNDLEVKAPLRASF